MAATRNVVDPITRIEGHLRIEAQAENGRISNAWATSTQFRGIEIIMEGRDPKPPAGWDDSGAPFGGSGSGKGRDREKGEAPIGKPASQH